ncbi:adenosylcobinamide-GDP ribazoletransferase [Colwellia sp. Bg11-28]|uniref:adenosylcobinamide-GDP ribazoletransferase n=1 Tax=Colwellia sp. Bg11-28 TaxID=2058305 RepID=UPI000C323DB1|nr:adenosylcobinamide-GDP ribazoletransferase [Colwellia sp. Bg11-28]PKH86710.1 adenosylcobinamide-GDP ribazoletransferase [Colwellia sp. Bg11-28]
MSVSVNEPLKNKVAAQLNLFYLALSFFTRLPVPKTMHYSEALLNKANRFFSLVGLVTGLLLALSYVCFSTFLPANISILLTMTISLLLTGAFHEDGLADMADGIGGAFTIEKRLTIMKDSRIGTYGAVTLVMALSLKFTLLVNLAEQDSNHLLLAIILAEVLSRAVAGSLISSMPYVSDIEQSKSKPLAQAQSSSELTILLLIGLAPLIFYSSEVIFSLLIVLVLFRWLFKQWLMARIGGFTGDCLGAGQQLSELLIYLTLVSYIDKDVFIGLVFTGYSFLGNSFMEHNFMGIVG